MARDVHIDGQGSISEVQFHNDSAQANSSQVDQNQIVENLEKEITKYEEEIFRLGIESNIEVGAEYEKRLIAAIKTEEKLKEEQFTLLMNSEQSKDEGNDKKCTKSMDNGDEEEEIKAESTFEEVKYQAILAYRNNYKVMKKIEKNIGNVNRGIENAIAVKAAITELVSGKYREKTEEKERWASIMGVSEKEGAKEIENILKRLSKLESTIRGIGNVEEKTKNGNRNKGYGNKRKIQCYFREMYHEDVPENLDTQRRKKQRKLIITRACRWTEREKKQLAYGVRQQNKELIIEKIMNDSEGTTEQKIEKINRLQSKRYNKELEYNIDGISWDEISRKYVLTQKPTACAIQWATHGHPMINKGLWSKEEEAALKGIVEENGGYDWVDIARKLNTNRTAAQCFKYYQRKLNNKLTKKHWNVDEDEMVRQLVSYYGEGQWQSISSCIEGRTSQQVLHRWYKVLHPMIKSGRWTEDEDALLLEAVKLYGVGKWTKISQHVPGRTDVKCRERYVNVLAPNVNHSKWTREEDHKLIEIVNRVGVGKWSYVSYLMGNRSDNQCWKHWQILHKRGMAHLPPQDISNEDEGSVQITVNPKGAEASGSKRGRASSKQRGQSLFLYKLNNSQAYLNLNDDGVNVDDTTTFSIPTIAKASDFGRGILSSMDSEVKANANANANTDTDTDTITDTIKNTLLTGSSSSGIGAISQGLSSSTKRLWRRVETNITNQQLDFITQNPTETSQPLPRAAARNQLRIDDAQTISPYLVNYYKSLFSCLITGPHGRYGLLNPKNAAEPLPPPPIPFHDKDTFSSAVTLTATENTDSCRSSDNNALASASNLCSNDAHNPPPTTDFLSNAIVVPSNFNVIPPNPGVYNALLNILSLFPEITRVISDTDSIESQQSSHTALMSSSAPEIGHNAIHATSTESDSVNLSHENTFTVDESELDSESVDFQNIFLVLYKLFAWSLHLHSLSK
ncbi:Myb-like protein L [Zancudomyces culisetae]|uniref:Myb-like protein L n=1 Tax=Zancudomyces culisetae TaxID=1213189 RepID=A0A1R1PXH3_ZANCU|nr:Myb-like protein L [Zancudomyces culisetae]|eukprot:OMH85671.1 Myb-like protein L [Zancudomyces culisetae]